MNKLILAAMSAGILSGCSSAPPLATPKGKFVDINTDITSLLPHSEPVYTGAKIASVASPLLSTNGVRNGNKDVLVSGKKEADKNNVVSSDQLLTAKSKEIAASDKSVSKTSPVSQKGSNTPILTAARKDVLKEVQKAAPGNGSKSVSPAPLTPVTPVSGRNPFSGGEPVKPIPTLVSKPILPVVPVIKVPVMKVWKIDQGTTLKNGFDQWVLNQICSAGKKWTVRWETDTDYPIDYPLSFSSASFEDATSQLFNLYRTAQSPLYVNGYRNQCLIVITDRK
ncbi:toxin co-regulated pilus biosynthesis Q family protein [Phytobacter ursingii]